MLSRKNEILEKIEIHHMVNLKDNVIENELAEKIKELGFKNHEGFYLRKVYIEPIDSSASLHFRDIFKKKR